MICQKLFYYIYELKFKCIILKKDVIHFQAHRIRWRQRGQSTTSDWKWTFKKIRSIYFNGSLQSSIAWRFPWPPSQRVWDHHLYETGFHSSLRFQRTQGNYQTWRYPMDDRWERNCARLNAWVKRRRINRLPTLVELEKHWQDERTSLSRVQKWSDSYILEKRCKSENHMWTMVRS